MNQRKSPAREIAVPVSVFAALRTQLEKEAGTLPTVHALHYAGYQAGTEAAAYFTGGAEHSVLKLGQDAFWSRLSDFFGDRGWGKLRHHPAHPAVGILVSSDWAEAGEGDDDDEASCFFSTGFLSGLLSALAGGPLAVLEVGCRARGEDACRFAFGSEAAIHELYGRLIEGVDLDGALAAL